MRKDLTGQRFGRLVAVEPTDKRTKDGNVVWSLKCDCGNTCEAPTSELLRDRVKSCGCAPRGSRALDLTGKRFGKLVVRSRKGSAPSGGALWECDCDCGNTVLANSSELLAGNRRSCGCAPRGVKGRDLAGQRFGKLVAVRPVGRRAGYILWECQCDCGGTRLATSKALTGGSAKSCGCASKRGRKPGPVPGKRFGRLTAIAAAGETRDGSPVWRCMCDCDRMVYPTAAELLSGAVTSCGECVDHGETHERRAG